MGTLRAIFDTGEMVKWLGLDAKSSCKAMKKFTKGKLEKVVKVKGGEVLFVAATSITISQIFKKFLLFQLSQLSYNLNFCEISHIIYM